MIRSLWQLPSARVWGSSLEMSSSFAGELLSPHVVSPTFPLTHSRHGGVCHKVLTGFGVMPFGHSASNVRSVNLYCYIQPASGVLLQQWKTDILPKELHVLCPHTSCSPPPLVTSILFTVFMFLLFLECHMARLSGYTVFSDWLFHLITGVYNSSMPFRGLTVVFYSILGSCLTLNL